MSNLPPEWQPYVDGLESRISELESKLEKAEREDMAAMHDIERLMDSANFELNRADKAESRIKELEAMSDRVTTVINDINPVALIGKPSYHPMCEMINEVRYKLKAILEQKCE